MRTVLEHLAKRQDGKPAAANTFRRRRAVLSNCLRLAVEHELLPGNTLLRVHWETPKAVEELDTRSVATPAHARALLDAVRAQWTRGVHLVAFFACIYYAAMRPEEVSMLSANQCDLPQKGWGRLMLAGARPQVGSAWTDDGKPYEERQLKHRARRAVRPVPIPPVLVAILRAHLDAFGTAPEGRLFSAPTRRADPVAGVWRRVERSPPQGTHPGTGGLSAGSHPVRPPARLCVVLAPLRGEPGRDRAAGRSERRRSPALLRQGAGR
ncbi:hypothetical protein AB0D27_12115 [Streptomyces sp. NPDC048415]|uniref:hypothetical protein n=1 Tax=Streptomyces sp. NPDC048415 TaxID=3154822 RepID=UPI00344497E5